jgi:hypothetical protein
MRVFGIVVRGTALASGAPSSADITPAYMRVMKSLACLFMGLTLCGCSGGLERLEAADDAACKRTIAQRTDPQPGAYEMCRNSLLSYRRNSAITAAGVWRD